ncbi:uncharacterized protein LOC131235379 isoform X2 [Magnolia sinica]|uniref:uncharacterized protein LOC131235379 isoform X2 n=1 Tax=Magnolia sinica TaxID=86752 RepID=UPI002657C95D|nr:uncharacterized protein LOC131235379 isoform X2 [Magnolia sinica]
MWGSLMKIKSSQRSVQIAEHPRPPYGEVAQLAQRYRKRRRRALDFLGEGGNMGMKEKQRKEKVLFLLQRKFAGEEEAEAAVLLMALSCGLFLHT